MIAPSAPAPLIAVRGLTKAYAEGGTRPVLEDLDLEVGPGERVAIMGRSGSGKTTLLNILGGLDRDASGQVRVAGQDLLGLSDRALSAFRNRTIGFVFQFHCLLPHLSCLDNVLLPWHFAAEVERQAVRARARWALERVGLPDAASRRPEHLSGGEQQRIAIARALLFEPPLLLSDEPTGSLDRASGEIVLDLFEELATREGVTLVVVTHESWVAARMDRTLVVEGGKLGSGERRPVEGGRP